MIPYDIAYHAYGLPWYLHSRLCWGASINTSKNLVTLWYLPWLNDYHIMVFVCTQVHPIIPWYLSNKTWWYHIMHAFMVIMIMMMIMAAVLKIISINILTRKRESYLAVMRVWRFGKQFISSFMFIQFKCFHINTVNLISNMSTLITSFLFVNPDLLESEQRAMIKGILHLICTFTL